MQIFLICQGVSRDCSKNPTPLIHNSFKAKIVKYTKEKGVIAIDTNASPIHLAIAEVSKTGELLSYQTISLHHLLGLSQNSKDHQEWILAHKIVDLAIQRNKAIAIENLKKLKKRSAWRWES